MSAREGGMQGRASESRAFIVGIRINLGVLAECSIFGSYKIRILIDPLAHGILRQKLENVHHDIFLKCNKYYTLNSNI